MRVAIVTVSDRGASGERKDETGPELKSLLEAHTAEVIGLWLVPDEMEHISAILCRLCAESTVDIVLTCGGTGLGPRDITPEATEAVIERRVPGLPEAMRNITAKLTARAMLSRATAGIREETLILNLPGSPKGAKECLEAVFPVLSHAVEMLQGKGHPATKSEK